MKKKYTWIIIIVVAVIVLIAAAANHMGIFGEKQTTKTTFAFDTYMKITAYGNSADGIISQAFDELSRIELVMSAYNAESELYKLNAQAHANVPYRVSEELYSVIADAEKFSQNTDGIFDITVKPLVDLWNIKAENPVVPQLDDIKSAASKVDYKSILLDGENKTITFAKEGMCIDLGGIAKGYAADRIKQIFTDSGAEKAIINLGGNIMLVGENKSNAGGRWNIGIQTPFDENGRYCIGVATAAKSVVSSGAYERNFTQDGKLYHHILDVRTGYPSENEIESVSVIADSSELCDMLSTTIFIMGIDDGVKLAQSYGVDVVILDSDKKIHTTLNKDDVKIYDSAYSFAD